MQKFENRLRFDKVAESLQVRFFETQCSILNGGENYLSNAYMIVMHDGWRLTMQIKESWSADVHCLGQR